MTDTRDEGRTREHAYAVPIEERAQRLRDHYEKVSMAYGEWCNQIPVAIDEWEQKRLRRTPETVEHGEDDIVERTDDGHLLLCSTRALPPTMCAVCGGDSTDTHDATWARACHESISIALRRSAPREK